MIAADDFWPPFRRYLHLQHANKTKRKPKQNRFRPKRQLSLFQGQLSLLSLRGR